MRYWAKDVRQCFGRWSRCDYFDYCDRQAQSGYKIDPSRIVVLSELAKPPAGWTISEAQAAVEAATSANGMLEGRNDISSESFKKDSRKKDKSPANEEAIKAFSLALLEAGRTVSGYEALGKDRFLVPGHTLDSTQKGLITALKIFYATLVLSKQSFTILGFKYTFQKTGLSWLAVIGEDKGRFTWRQIAEWICLNDWFDPTKALAASGVSNQLT
jgi:hypothetical protein